MPKRNEPLVTRAGIVALVGAALGVAAAFGLDLSEEQREALTIAAGVVGPLVVAWWARRHVTPTATVNAETAEGGAEGATDGR